MRRLLRLVFFAAIVAVVYWIVRDKPTVSEFVDRITSPLFGSKAAVKESERNRVLNEAMPAVGEDEEKKVASLREGMRPQDLRDLFGYPDTNEPVTRDGHNQMRWTYRRLRRTLYFEENRLVEIVIDR